MSLSDRMQDYSNRFFAHRLVIKYFHTLLALFIAVIWTYNIYTMHSVINSIFGILYALFMISLIKSFHYKILKVK